MDAATIDCYTGSFYGIFHHFGENFGRQILTLVSNVVLEGFQGLGLVHINTGLQKTPQKKSGTVKSGDLAGQCKSPKREMRRPGNAALRISVVARAVCAVAPSCWNHMSSNPNSFNCGRKNSVNMAL